MANENLKKQMVVKLGTTTNTEAQLISNMVDGALSGKGGDSSDPELENLKKQMVIKLGTTTNEDAQIISNMVDNAAGGGGGGSSLFKTAKVTIINNTSEDLLLSLPVYYVEEESGMFITGQAPVDASSTFVFDAIIPSESGFTALAKDPQISENSVEITGDAEYSGGMIAITGDCTITFIS